MKRIPVFLVISIITSSLWISCTRNMNIIEPEQTETILIGGLFSLSSNLTALGQDSKAAMELAIADVNAVMNKNSAPVRLSGSIEDTQLDPNQALAQMQSLAGKGIKYFIGPSSSAEVEAVKTLAESNNLLVISHYSTAGRLAIADDNIYRFCPSDVSEGPAVTALSLLDGIQALVPIWRNDAGNQGLHDAVNTAFTAKGGTFYNGYRYETTTTDFTAAIVQIRQQVDQAIAQKGADHVAVYAASFDEIVDILKASAADPVLSILKWYCGDGVALNAALLNDAVAAAVAIQTRAESPNLSYDQSAISIWQPLAQRIKSVTGNDGNPFALAVYDAVWVLANTLIATKTADDNLVVFKQEFERQANAYFGATGWTSLNEAGDRRVGNYDFWLIDASKKWVKSAYYDGTSDRAGRF